MATYPLYCLSPRQLPFRLAHICHEIVICSIAFLSVLIEAVTALAARGALIGPANIKCPRYWSSRVSKEYSDRRFEWCECTWALSEMLKSRIAFYLDIPHACGNGYESVLWWLEKCGGRMVEHFSTDQTDWMLCLRQEMGGLRIEIFRRNLQNETIYLH